MRALILTLVLAGPAWAETPMDGDTFEAFVAGKTLTFLREGQPYGMEYYAPNRRVIWSIINGDCVNGKWHEEPTDLGPSICFIYEHDPEPQCWQVFDQGGKLRADYMNRPGTTVLYEAVEAEPLICSGVGT